MLKMNYWTSHTTNPTEMPDATILVHNDFSFGAILFPNKL